MIDKAHEVGAAVLIDGAQAVPHLKPDMQALDCDFYVFSGHMWTNRNRHFIRKEEWLNKLPPYQGGGEMIKEVSSKNNLCGITT
jgi:cysteine desulfurase/selenocysteine lyase